MARAIGIDLGTPSSAVAATMEGGRAEIIPNAEGGRTTPSVVVHRGRAAAGGAGRAASGSADSDRRGGSHDESKVDFCTGNEGLPSLSEDSRISLRVSLPLRG